MKTDIFSKRKKRMVSVLMVVVLIAGMFMDFFWLDNTTVDAAGTTLYSETIALKFKEKIESLGWAKATVIGSGNSAQISTNVSENFWQDTSKFNISRIDTDSSNIVIHDPVSASAVGRRITFPENTDISGYLTEGNAVSENTYSGVTSVYTYQMNSASVTIGGEELKQKLEDTASDLWDSVAGTVADNVTTKTITLSDITYPRALLDKNSDILDTIFYTVEYDSALQGYYRNYYVSTADQLAVLLYYYEKNFTSLKAQAAETDGVSGGTNKLGIELLCDLDLGGSKDSRWCGRRNPSYCLEIDGNGHHIYNGYFNNTLSAETYTWTETRTATATAEGAEEKKETEVSRTESNLSTQYGCFLGYSTTDNSTDKISSYVDQRFAIRNLTYSNMYVDQNLSMFNNASMVYFDNVNWEYCLAAGSAQAYASFGLVLKQSYSKCYFKDCVISDSYMMGNAHCALFASYNSPVAQTTEMSYIGDTTDGVSLWYYTDIPETVTKTNEDGTADTLLTDSVEAVELTWYDNRNYVKADNGTVNRLTYSYPSIFENCATVDSEVYDIGANHSGTFVSCLQGDIIFKNCFSNCTIYAKTQQGVFTGACIGSGDGFYYPYNGEKKLVNSYFENCYTSGSIEGNSSIGGFVGMLFDDRRAYDLTFTTPATQKRGQVVFKDCYSTSSVGMQYSGDYVGGFVGLVRGNIQAEDPSERQHIFENCYAAGEVGGNHHRYFRSG